MLICGDFEVFKHDWLVVFVDALTGEQTTIVNDAQKLTDYFEKNSSHVFCFFNGRQYDNWIMKAIILGLDPYDVSKFIIEGDHKGFEYDRRMNDIPLIHYDAMYSKFVGLKKLEGFLGLNIHETDVAFDIDRPLTEEELRMTIEYCEADVYNMMEVMIHSKNEFDAIWSLIKVFDLPMSYFSKSKAQLTGAILDCERVERNDEWDISLPDYECKLADKYKFVQDWFLDPANHSLDAHLEVEVAGLTHQFGYGGVHAAIDNYFAEGKHIESDVSSMYPSIMIEWGTLSRNVRHREKFIEVYNTRLRLKAEGKNIEQAPYKIILNSTFGASADKFNPLYDPRQARLTCIYGQLFLLDLISNIEPYAKIVQSNTDATMFVPNDDECEQKCLEIIKDWERRTRLKMVPEYFDFVAQKDVNNYIIRSADEKQKLTCKGAFVKKNSPLDNDMPIVNKAVREFIANRVPVETTIRSCMDLIEFQKIFTRSAKYDACYYGTIIGSQKGINPLTGRTKTFKKVESWGEKLTDKTYRVFAVTDENKGGLFKYKNGTDTPAKFAGTPEHAVIMNEDIRGKKTYDLEDLDKQFYIDLANERIAKFKSKGKVKNGAKNTDDCEEM